jgi:type I restriction enzyme S subunit
VTGALWNKVPLGAHCSKIGSGFTPRGGETVYQQDGISFIRSQNVYNGYFLVDGLAFLDDTQAERLNGVTVDEGDVLLNITGDSVARSCRAPETILPAHVNQHVAIIRPNPKDFDSRFLSYFLISPFMQATMLSLAGSGGTRKALTKQMIERFEVPKPPRPVQQKIADALCTYDELTDNNRRRMVLLEAAARQLYREWFVRFRFPGHERSRITNGVPEGWERQKIGDLLTLKRGYDLPETKRVPGNFPVVSSSGISGSHNEKKASAPGVVTGRYGTLGEVFMIEADYWPLNTALYVSDFKGNSPRFVFHFLRHSLEGLQSDKAAVPGVNRNLLHSLPVIWPPKALRDRFNDFAQLIYEQIHILKRSSEKLREGRDLLLPRLMNGEIAM